METILEFWAFCKKRKKYWLYPIFFSLIFLALVVAFSKGSALAPFLYTIF